MADLVVTKPGLTGTAPGLVPAAAGGDRFKPASRHAMLRVKNDHTAAQSVIIDDPTSQTPAGATAFDPDVTNSIPNAAERYIMLANVARFRDANGWVNLTYSGATALSVEAIQLPD